MSERQIVFTGLLLGLAIYAPIGVYFFDNSITTMLDRAYFTLGGAAIALYASPRAAVGNSLTPAPTVSEDRNGSR